MDAESILKKLESLEIEREAMVQSQDKDALFDFYHKHWRRLVEELRLALQVIEADYWPLA